MNKNAKSVLVFGLISVAVLVFVLSFVFATSFVLFSSGGTSRSVNQTVGNIYNITVNVTGGAKNISQVNITLPANFAFTGSNQTTNANRVVFSNVTNATGNTILSWFNESNLVGNLSSTGIRFAFNATATAPGIYNISVITMDNTSAIVNQTNMSITVNDTIFPSLVQLNSPVNSYNSSSTTIAFNWSAVDNYATTLLCNVTVDSTVNASSNIFIINGSTNSNSSSVAGLSEGSHTWNVSCRDNQGLLNISETRNFTIDTSVPSSITMNSPADRYVSSSADVTFNWTAVDNLTSIKCNLSIDGSVSVSDIASANDSMTTQEVSSIADGIHSWHLICMDSAGNSLESDTLRFDVDTSASASSSSGGSSGTALAPYFNYAVTDSQLSSGYTQSLGVNGGMKFNVAGVAHSLKVSSVSSSGVTVIVSSTPQTVTVGLGETKNVDLDGDGVNDISVRVNSIASDGKTASITTMTIPAESPAATTSSATTSSESTSTGASASSGISTWVYVVIAVIIVAIIAYFLMKRKR